MKAILAAIGAAVSAFLLVIAGRRVQKWREHADREWEQHQIHKNITGDVKSARAAAERAEAFEDLASDAKDSATKRIDSLAKHGGISVQDFLDAYRK